MSALVNSWEEIRDNLITLDNYRRSSDDEVKKYFQERIRLGTCFIVYSDARNRTYFGPSRFLGYAKNSRRAHIGNESKHGGVTNGVIQTILRDRFRKDPAIDGEFRKFCKEHGVAPADKARRFIRYGELDDRDLLGDLSEIRKGKISKTEKQRLASARIGQGEFRNSLLRLWRQCPVTGCANQALLRASHIKPWRCCSNWERLDPYNGILLSPNVDAAFDRGLLSFGGDGKILISEEFSLKDSYALGIKKGVRISIDKEHKQYLSFHRKHWGFEV